MQRIKDIQTPKTLDQFRVNLKKFCLGSKNNIFIFNKSDGKDYKVDVEKISKISDVINLIETQKNNKLFSLYLKINTKGCLLYTSDAADE